MNATTTKPDCACDICRAKPPNETGYTLHLHPLPNDRRPPEQRLKGLLKAALRRWGFRCQSIKINAPPKGEHANTKPRAIR